MSSRNVRLTPEMRAAAPVIYQTLLTARAAFQIETVQTIQAHAVS